MKAIRLIAGLAALALLAAGCGGGAKSPTVAHLGSSTTSSTSRRASSSSGSAGSGSASASSASPGSQAVAYSACMRAHGVPNFPDPKVSTNGNEVKVAVEGHAGHHRQSPVQLGAEGLQQAAARRRSGRRLEPPDQPAGTVAVPEGRGVHPLLTAFRTSRTRRSPAAACTSRTRGIDLHSPQARAAEEACQSLIPGGLHGNH